MKYLVLKKILILSCSSGVCDHTCQTQLTAVDSDKVEPLLQGKKASFSVTGGIPFSKEHY